MIERNFQLKELEEARRLQDKLAALHVPSPVLSWRYEVKNANSVTVERGIGKANSYTRNALNNLAFFVGLSDIAIKVSTGFADGIISQKGSDGTVLNYTTTYSSTGVSLGRMAATDQTTYNPRVHLGTGTVETLDDYSLPEYSCTNSISSVFNSSTRKLITTITGVYVNSTGSEILITEAGASIKVNSYTAPGQVLMLHDVFSPISIADGHSITWTYVTEVAYPNP